MASLNGRKGRCTHCTTATKGVYTCGKCVIIWKAFPVFEEHLQFSVSLRTNCKEVLVVLNTITITLNKAHLK